MGLKIVTLDCAMSIEIAVKIYEVVGHMLDGTTREKRQKNRNLAQQPAVLGIH